MSGAKTVAGVLVGTVVSLAIGALAGAGVASAGEDDYVNDLANSNINGPRAQLVRMGYLACANKSGKSRADSIQDIVNQSKQNGSKGLDEQQADFLYGSAMRNLCGR